MSYHAIFAGIVAVTALSMLLNERYFKLPKNIALTIISVTLSFVITQLIHYSPAVIAPIHALLSGVDFKITVLDVMLGYLLFASGLHINTIALKKQFSVVFYLASIGVITSTVFTAVMLWTVSHWINFSLSFEDCLIFGALISPTDPIAVASVFRSTKNVTERTKTRITGEALFNDAAGILLLVILVHIFYLNDASKITPQAIGLIVIKEALGGVVMGGIVGYLTALLLKRTRDTEVGILLTLTASSCGYILSQNMHVSGAITMVIAGLIVGNFSRSKSFNVDMAISLNKFWDLIDGIFNAFLFVLIGLEMLTIYVNYTTFLIGVLGVIIVFIARFGSMLLPSVVMVAINYKKHSLNWIEMTLLCWGGIRGAISVALALSIPSLPSSLVAITYFIVIFSILIQGSSFKWLINKIAVTTRNPRQI